MLGLSPQSTFYSNFFKTYFDPMNRINFLLCLYPNHEFFGIDSSNSPNAAQIPIAKDSLTFNVPAVLELKNDPEVSLQKNLRVCFSNDSDLLFQSMKSLTLLLTQKICKNELHCYTKDDLNSFDDHENVLSLTFEGG